MIVIDKPRHYPGKRKAYSHLMSDLLDEKRARQELELFARNVNLKPCWHQHPGTVREHYDVADDRYQACLDKGARQVGRDEIVGILAAKREVRAAQGVCADP
jgi:hypothetical protein